MHWTRGNSILGLDVRFVSSYAVAGSRRKRCNCRETPRFRPGLRRLASEELAEDLRNGHLVGIAACVISAMAPAQPGAAETRICRYSSCNKTKSIGVTPMLDVFVVLACLGFAAWLGFRCGRAVGNLEAYFFTTEPRYRHRNAKSFRQRWPSI